MARTKEAELLPGTDEDEAVVYEVRSKEQEPERLTDADLKTLEFLDKAASYGAEASIIIRKQSEDGTDTLDYCERVPVDRFDFWQLHDYIANKYGGGVYRLFVTRKGTRGLLENILITISKKAEKIDSAKTGDPVMMRLLDRLEAMEEKMSNRINGPVVDPMANMKQFLEMMTMMQALQPKQTPMGELVGLIKSLKDVGPMIGLGETEKDDGPSWASIIGPALQALPAIVGAAQHQPRPRPRPIRPNPQAKPVPPVTPVNGAKDVPTLTPEQQALKPYIEQAVWAARVKADPVSIAEKLCEAVDQQPNLESALIDPEIVDKLAKIVPEVTKHREWFADVVEWAKGMLGHPSKYESEFSDDDDIDGVPAGDEVPGTPNAD